MDIIRRNKGKNISGAWGIALVLLLAAIIRFPSFYLPHNHGDQLFFLGNALKLDKFGMREYNLRGLDFKGNQYIGGLFLSVSEKEGKGGLLESQFKNGIFYYDEPVYHLPPLFSYALMWSHRVFTDEEPYYIVYMNLKEKAIFELPRQFLTIQFYCVILPFVFSLLSIVMVFLIGKKFFSEEVGFYAAMMMAVAPINILTSQRIWADDMVCFFLILGAILFYMGHSKNNVILSGIGGVSVGLSALTKPNGGFIVFAIILYCLWQGRKELLSRRIFQVIFNKHLMVFGMAVFLTNLPWFYLMTKTYGSPLYKPPYQPGLEKIAWFHATASRPWYTYLVGIPYQLPLFVLGYMEFILTFWKNSAQKRLRFLLFSWIIVYFYFMNIHFHWSKEHRYLLPVYAPLAILSGIMLNRIEKFVRSKIGNKFGLFIIMLIIVATSLWSIRIGLKYVFMNSALIPIPF